VLAGVPMACVASLRPSSALAVSRGRAALGGAGCLPNALLGARGAAVPEFLLWAGLGKRRAAAALAALLTDGGERERQARPGGGRGRGRGRARTDGSGLHCWQRGAPLKAAHLTFPLARAQVEALRSAAAALLPPRAAAPGAGRRDAGDAAALHGLQLIQRRREQLAAAGAPAAAPAAAAAAAAA
jgi:hypothetical protein